MNQLEVIFINIRVFHFSSIFSDHAALLTSFSLRCPKDVVKILGRSEKSRPPPLPQSLSMGSEPPFSLYKKFKIVLESWLMAHFVGIFILNNFKKNTNIHSIVAFNAPNFQLNVTKIRFFEKIPKFPIFRRFVPRLP